MGGLLEAKGGAVAEYCLVKNLPSVSVKMLQTGFWSVHVTCRKYTQTRMASMTLSVLRRMRLFWGVFPCQLAKLIPIWEKILHLPPSS